MPTFTPAEAVEYITHGSTFAAYVNTSRGSVALCAWRLTVPPNVAGVAHRPSNEEVLLVLDGMLRITIDGIAADLVTGAVAHVPAGSLLQVDTGPEGGSAWVTTTPGLTASTQDGTKIIPAWAQ